MRPRPLSEVARAVDGRLRGTDATVTAVVIDSREAGPGSLFFAMPGGRRDGHDFATDALSRGAVGSVVHRPVLGEPAVEVADSGEALLALAADERARMPDATVIGITGANGKTSTKDLAASILSTGFLTHASPGSFNNEIGLPLTLLGAPEGVEVVLTEMGARRRGDHAELCRVAKPDAVVVTNIGVAHMEVFGSWQAIVEASAEPVEALADVGTAILNADDTVVRGLAERTRARVVTCGLTEDADVRAECAAGLKGVGVSRWRMESFTTEDGVRVVNDAYNANPESMAAGLRAARWMARGGRLAAVLGHMAELGPISGDEHERLGELVVRLGVDHLVTVGPVARIVAGAAIREGAVPDCVLSVDTAAEAAVAVRAWAKTGDVVLVKGSRVAGLERVAEALR